MAQLKFVILWFFVLNLLHDAFSMYGMNQAHITTSENPALFLAFLVVIVFVLPTLITWMLGNKYVFFVAGPIAIIAIELTLQKAGAIKHHSVSIWDLFIFWYFVFLVVCTFYLCLLQVLKGR